MKIYNYDKDGKYIGEELADESPLEEGVFLIPAFATDKPPLPEKEGYEVLFDGGEWVYNIIIPPKPNEYSVLVDNNWVIDSVLKSEHDSIEKQKVLSQAKGERDSLISQVEWRRTRHQDEVTLGMEPTEPLLPILEYIQALREVPQQEGFPVNVVWPVPSWDEEVIND